MSEKLGGASKRSLVALDALYLILADVHGGLGPFLAIYLASVHHWDPARIGTVMAVTGFTGLASQTPAGAIIDAVREKRAVIMVAFALVALAALAMVFVPTPSVVISAQAVIGASGAVFGPSMAAISLGLVGHAGLARRMGRNQALDHTGNIIAAALAGLIGDSVGYGGIFVMAAVMCLGGIFAVSLIRGADIDQARARGGDAGPTAVDRAVQVVTLRQLCADRRILIFAAAVVLFHFANAPMLPLVGQKLTSGVTTGAARAMSACIIAAQLVMIPVALAASRFAVSWGRKPILLIGFAVLPLRGALYTLSDNPFYLVTVQCLDGVGAGIFGVVGILVIADLTRGTGRFNLMQGVLATATGLGGSLSNLVTGAVVNAAGFDAGFLLLAAIAGVALVFFGLAMPETSQSRPAVPSVASDPALAKVT